MEFGKRDRGELTGLNCHHYCALVDASERTRVSAEPSPRAWEELLKIGEDVAGPRTIPTGVGRTPAGVRTIPAQEPFFNRVVNALARKFVKSANAEGYRFSGSSLTRITGQPFMCISLGQPEDGSSQQARIGVHLIQFLSWVIFILVLRGTAKKASFSVLSKVSQIKSTAATS